MMDPQSTPRPQASLRRSAEAGVLSRPGAFCLRPTGPRLPSAASSAGGWGRRELWRPEDGAGSVLPLPEGDSTEAETSSGAREGDTTVAERRRGRRGARREWEAGGTAREAEGRAGGAGQQGELGAGAQALRPRPPPPARPPPGFLHSAASLGAESSNRDVQARAEAAAAGERGPGSAALQVPAMEQSAPEAPRLRGRPPGRAALPCRPRPQSPNAAGAAAAPARILAAAASAAAAPTACLGGRFRPSPSPLGSDYLRPAPRKRRECPLSRFRWNGGRSAPAA